MCNVGQIKVINSELKWSTISFDGLKVVSSGIFVEIFKIKCLSDKACDLRMDLVQRSSPVSLVNVQRSTKE